MAPVVNGKAYDKDLNVEPQGINRQGIVFKRSFFNNFDGCIYTIEIYPIRGSYYSGCIEVKKHHYDKEDRFTEEYAQLTFTETGDKFISAKEALDLGIPPVSELLVARYVYKDTYVKDHTSGQDVLGKQIKGAFVDPDYEGVKITREVYLAILDNFRVLISDDVQTIDGHSLWAFGLAKMGRVNVFDSIERLCLGELNPKGKVPLCGIAPWSIEKILDTQLSELREGFWTNDQCCKHLLLVLRAEDLH